jgi:hypothetical protein
MIHGDLLHKKNYLCGMAEAYDIFALQNFFHLLTTVQSASCRLSEGLFDVCVAQWVSTYWGWVGGGLGVASTNCQVVLNP